jgi:peptidoglycan/LPS O-acetylase OafA/YrhL
MPQRFLPRIESMRGIAALTVVGFHVSNPFAAGPASGWFDGSLFGYSPPSLTVSALSLSFLS